MSGWILRIMAIDVQYPDAGSFMRAVTAGLANAGLEIRGILVRGDDEYEPVGACELGALFDASGNTHIFQLAPDEGVTLTVGWFPPLLPFTTGGWGQTVQIPFDGPTLRSRVEEVFLSLCESIRPFWGEILDDSVTIGRSMCGVNGHYTCVPHLGLANFFGPDYIEFFGGVERIREAGFAEVRDVAHGVYVTLPAVSTNDEYLRVREAIQAKLAPPNTFGEEKGRRAPKFRFPR
jgi:hypothetical protein